MTLQHDLLDEIAHLLADADDDALTREVSAAAVTTLERMAGAPLVTTAGEPLVVLTRRFARAHRLLDGRAASSEALGLLRTQRDALRDPGAALLRTCASTTAAAVSASASADAAGAG